MKELVKDVHTYKPDGANKLCHLGKRKTMEALSGTYYSFDMRKIVHEVVSTCGNCRLNNHVRTNPEDHGNQIRTEPNSIHWFLGSYKWLWSYNDRPAPVCDDLYWLTFKIHHIVCLTNHRRQWRFQSTAKGTSLQLWFPIQDPGRQCFAEQDLKSKEVFGSSWG